MIARLALLALFAGTVTASEHNRYLDADGTYWLFAPTGDLLALERVIGGDSSMYYDPNGQLMGWSHYDASLSGRGFYDFRGELVGFERPNYSSGVDLFAADGTYRGASLGATAGGDDLDVRGNLVPGGLFPVRLYWTQEAGSAGFARW